MSTTTQHQRSITATSGLQLLWLIVLCFWILDVFTFASPLSPVDHTPKDSSNCMVVMVDPPLDPRLGGYDSGDSQNIAPCATQIVTSPDASTINTGDPGGF